MPRPLLSADLAARLRAAGLDPDEINDPADAWNRLHASIGLRATLVDRYVLEAAHRGIAAEALEPELRDRLTNEVLRAHSPQHEFVPGSERTDARRVEVVDYEPAWGDRFAEWRDRLGRALGPVARRIEHVGSTAVPGLAAKPIVDIQVSVVDLEDEAAYVPAIEAEGIALRLREEGHRYFRPAGDRPRTVHIHVCGSGSAWERNHLLFRDYLRADAATRDAYAAVKRAAASRYRDDGIAYTEAKTTFVLDALERAEEWAAATGWRIS
jgi:GrpB-like predicted nucleotidyltransferase (UPF0157 family)